MTTFEIRKAGFQNKGASLMLIAALREVAGRYADARIAIAPGDDSPFDARTSFGIWHRAEILRHGFDFGRVLEWMVPAKLRERYGFVTWPEIDVMLDAAGLAYSDQWGTGPTQDMAARCTRLKRAGKKIILLPQAFGPFGNADIRRAITTVADQADLIFARDAYSLEHLVSAVGERSNIRLAPDFTNLLPGMPPRSRPEGERLVAIVPNARMIDKTSPAISGSYVGFLEHVVEFTQDAGMSPFFLIHEGVGDLKLAEDVNSLLTLPVPIWVARDALEAKGLIGTCSALIGSRYHALISALSQGVPAVGTGWSHKYQALFEDYDCINMLAEVTCSKADLDRLLQELADDDRRTALADNLLKPSQHLKEAVRLMWEDVHRVIRNG